MPAPGFGALHSFNGFLKGIYEGFRAKVQGLGFSITGASASLVAFPVWTGL